jgi:ankyrin repeat protein
MWGSSAMHYAAGKGNHEMARKILETGKCELSDRNKEGWTSLDIAKRKGHQEVVDLLIRYGSGE